MRNQFKLTLLFLFPIFVFAQNINDASTYKKVVKLSQEQKKPIFLIIGVKIPASVNYKVAPNPAFQDSEIIKTMKNNFIVFESDRSDPELSKMIEKQKIRNFPYYLFLHPNEDAFHAEFGYMSNKTRFKLMLDRAIILSKEKSITELETAYSLAKNNNDLLKNLITLRRKNGITNNADLIEEYTKNLKISDLGDYETVLFILQAGPYVDGNAYKYAYTNRKVIDSLFKKEPAPVRSEFINAIINNTMEKAKKDKNLNQALLSVNFLRNSWGRDFQSGNKNASAQMLAYYLSVKDTASYFRNAVTHYDNYFMNMSADSIKKLENKLRQAALANTRTKPFTAPSKLTQKQIDSLKASPNTVTRRETISVLSAVNSMSNGYANSLNSAAWNFYETGTTNINYLLKAVAWSTRALELSKIATYYDTLAHVFYRLGYFEQAIKTQEIGINQAKIDGSPYDKMQDELKKMKTKKL